MKKILCSLATILMIAVGARADEGMWLLPLLKQMNIKSMKSLGCKLSASDIYDINHSSLKDAIVQFGGGCTGEIISNEGLLVTNHHCGYSNIQKLSTNEHNYLEDGYWAMTRNEELPCKGLSVKFLQTMQDVTAEINKETERLEKEYNGNEEEIAKAMNKFTQELEAKALKDYPHCEASVTSFYNDNVFYLIVYKTFTDVRFVGAPPAAVGKFGGETDNWMWPRHTGDFSMFRVYAGKDNEPADYSESNVPYVPKKSLTISLKGVKEGDFSFIMGYPGRTQRFQTTAQLKNMLSNNDIRIAARTVRQNVMMEGMESSPAIRLQYANKYAGSANGWKKWQGEKLAFEKLGIIKRENEKEANFVNWYKENSSREKEFENALPTITNNVDSIAFASDMLTLANETLFRIGPFDVFSSYYNGFAKALQAGKDSTTANLDGINEAKKEFKDYNENVERNIAVAMINFYRDHAKPADYPKVNEDFATMDTRKFVDNLFDNSVFASEKNLMTLKDLSRKEALSKVASDPCTNLYNATVGVYAPFFYRYREFNPMIKEGSKLFTKGLLEWQKGKPSYPDANFTMRLTYGTVKPYSPKDGVLYNYYTTLEGVMEKDNPNSYEFKVPAKLKAEYEAKNFGQYADKKDGKIHVCFLTNNDITGGNSGSPVLNAKGELIGLAFDGNWESMSSDIMFEPQLQRCICVDIRYVLFMMDKVGGAHHLLNEMNISK